MVRLFIREEAAGLARLKPGAARLRIWIILLAEEKLNPGRAFVDAEGVGWHIAISHQPPPPSWCRISNIDSQFRLLAPYLSYAIFLGMWIVITTTLGALSGWFSLQRRYQAGSEASRLTLRRRSGRMGCGICLKDALTLSACPSGLRIFVLRIVGPFQKTVTVPWDQIKAKPQTLFFMPGARLSFGDRDGGNLTIDAWLWQRLSAHSSFTRGSLEIRSSSMRRVGFGLLMRWVIVTAGAATFYYVAGHMNGAVGSPLVICVTLPAVVYGMAMLVRFFGQIK